MRMDGLPTREELEARRTYLDREIVKTTDERRKAKICAYLAGAAAAFSAAGVVGSVGNIIEGIGNENYSQAICGALATLPCLGALFGTGTATLHERWKIKNVHNYHLKRLGKEKAETLSQLERMNQSNEPL